MSVSYEVSKMMENGFSLDKELQFLLHVYISQVNQCNFCIDIGKAVAMKECGSLDKIEKPAWYQSDPSFTPAERAALAYVEEVARTKTASDATFAELRRHFSEDKVVEITLLNAMENFYNLINRSLGTPISAGTVRGRVKVMHSPDEKPLLKGEILVARATDPGWTPLFVNAGGVILETGGLLQHGALVAREYGLPCVAGIVNATELWPDGTLVEVNGSAGIVRLVAD